MAFRIECSKGTYVRTICNDIGEKLGVYGTMERLMRTRVSQFKVEESYLLSEAEEFAKQGKLEELLVCADKCFTEYQRLDVKAKYDDLLINGNQLWFRHLVPPLFNFFSADGGVLTVFVLTDAGRWRADSAFHVICNLKCCL